MQKQQISSQTNVEALADIRDVHVNKSLPKEQRISEFIRQIKNPHLFRCGQITVHVGFTAIGVSLEDCIAGLLH